MKSCPSSAWLRLFLFGYDVQRSPSGRYDGPCRRRHAHRHPPRAVCGLSLRQCSPSHSGPLFWRRRYLSLWRQQFQHGLCPALYGLFRLSRRKRLISSDIIAAGIGSYVGINVAAFCAAVEFGIQPLLFTDAAGQALYCPYPLSISIPAMMIGHITIFGLAEVIFTTGVLAYLKKTSPDLFHMTAPASSSKSLFGLLAALILATPLGLLAAGTAWGEWDVEELAETDSFGASLGYTPAGMENGFSFDVLMPDYAIAGLPDALGYIISALVGTALLIIIFKVIASFLPAKPSFDTPSQH